MIRDILIYDIETDGLNTKEVKLKWFGCYSYIDDEYYLIENDIEKIKELLKRHRVLVGFNNKAFDNEVLVNNGFDLNYKLIIDLFEMSGQKGVSEYNKNFKNKLIQMGIKINRFSLKEIVNVLKLDESKGDKLKVTIEVQKR